jgi:hypothetical protein
LACGFSVADQSKTGAMNILGYSFRTHMNPATPNNVLPITGQPIPKVDAYIGTCSATVGRRSGDYENVRSDAAMSL